MLDRPLLRGFLESAAGEWVLILSFVFGGCCSNVWALEAVLKDHPKSGTFLTFAQFVYVTLQTLSSQFYFPRGSSKSWFRIPRLRKRQVPLKRWMVQVVLFLAVSLMNNYAFGLKIPVTVHIIFRSGGLCVSMLTGYFFAGRRYSLGQVFAGVTITAGIIIATLSAPRRPRSPSSAISTASTASTASSTTLGSSGDEWLSDTMQYTAGIGLLAAALVVSAWLGLWQEQTYRVYGKQWREALFYSHFLSLPFFIPLYPTLSTTFRSFAQSPPITLVAVPKPTPSSFLASPIQSPSALGAGGKAWEPFFGLVEWTELVVPSAIAALLVNVVTQGICVRGVNRLTSRVNSTSVNLVLTLRKAVSLAISVWYYGSGVSTGLAIGGLMVLAGTVVYSLAPGPKVVHEEKVKELEDIVDDTAETGVVLKSSAQSGTNAQAAGGLRQRGVH
ncbi:hypothetical protein JCM24511_07747 [Saitozyma sp. JCM 24511]|nr:hypothetical protein JCM24511_07747 [Saitozyma sp. JCM 24511]